MKDALVCYKYKQSKDILIRLKTTNKPPKSHSTLFFRTDAMYKPICMYEENPKYPDEVACAVQFVTCLDEETKDLSNN
jgi:hypothetical protein